RAAGISRSPALAVAYVMYRLEMDLDHAYRFVKERRPTISPNFNFLGQLQLFQSTLNQKGPGGDPMARQQENQGPSADETVSRSLCSQNQNYLSQSVSADPSQSRCSLLHDSGKQQGPQTLDQNHQCSRGPHEAQSTCLQFPLGTASLLERRKSLSLSLRPLGTCTPPLASSSPQSAGAPQPEEVLRGPCHSQSPVKVRGPLSPFSLSLNKLLEWGERLLLGGLFVPPVRMGQPSLSYRY
ncbi:uncharacterized protein si:ch211-195b15.8, partial [Cyprinodon tularosa]|uniref:uncharacterized protein si:ch211-195b15.8 n=1 Tax=Cyprinodon tularosa TaxID=77115 RepID=UPI0018E231F1